MSIQLPREIQDFLVIKQREKALSSELKTIRSHAAEFQGPVMSWMADNELDQLKLSSSGMCIERVDSEKSVPMTRQVRNQLIHTFFDTMDHPEWSANQRAQSLIQFLDDLHHREKKRVARLSCRIVGAPSGPSGGRPSSSGSQQ